MTTAEHYRKNHRELKRREAKEESGLKVILESLALFLAIGIILAMCFAVSPEMGIWQ